MTTLASAGDVLFFLGIAAVGYIIVAGAWGRIMRNIAKNAGFPPAEPGNSPPAPTPSERAPVEPVTRDRRTSAPPTLTQTRRPYRTCTNPECRQIAVGSAAYCPRCGTRLPPE